jgi:hypothetical protein
LKPKESNYSKPTSGFREISSSITQEHHCKRASMIDTGMGMWK